MMKSLVEPIVSLLQQILIQQQNLLQLASQGLDVAIRSILASILDSFENLCIAQQLQIGFPLHYTKLSVARGGQESNAVYLQVPLSPGKVINITMKNSLQIWSVEIPLHALLKRILTLNLVLYSLYPILE